MAIVFGADVGIREDAFSGFIDSISDSFSSLIGKLTSTAIKAENVYVDDGFSKVPGTAFVGSKVSEVRDVKKREIITQEPQLTVYIKKRAFWSLRNEFDSRFQDQGDKLLTRASKILFENKCTQIAAYEGITKASRLISEDAFLDASRIDTIIDYLDGAYGAIVDSLNSARITTLDTTLTAQISAELDKIIDEYDKSKKSIESLRKIVSAQKKLNSATYTNWVVDPENINDIANTGRGAGVIELTCVSEVSTDLGLEDSLGSINFSMEDPFGLSKITEQDISMALGAAYNEIYSNNQVSLGPSKILDDAKLKDEELRIYRRKRIEGGAIVNLLGGTSGNFTSASTQADIVFEIGATSSTYNKVVGFVSSISEPFTKNDFMIVLNTLPVKLRPDGTETRLISEIFDLLENYVSEVERLRNTKESDNDTPDVAYARRNLRNFYLGKSIIQPMDGVHIFIRGNTLSSGDAIGPISTFLNNSDFVESFNKDSSSSDEFLEEEMRLFGLKDIDIPISLYRTLRTGSFMRNAGNHVFGGLVSTVSESYSPDRGYTLNITGQSNMKWLNQSRVNVKPSLDQTQGVLEDPLTPFEIQVDPGTGLIVSEPPLLGENYIRNLTFRSGINSGKKLTNLNIVQDYLETGTKITQHTPGMVYKWKSGIISVARNINLRTALDGSGVKDAKLSREVGRTVVENPFSSMDAADVVSILVTGFPHNYESFLSHTRDSGTFTFGSGVGSPESFFHSTFDILRTQNRALGNFQPFKTININPKQMAQRLALQLDLQDRSDGLNKLKSKLAELDDQINSLNSSVGPDQTNMSQKDQKIFKDFTQTVQNDRTSLMKGLQSDRNSISEQIDKLTAEFKSQINIGIENGLRIYGSDMALEIDNELTQDDENISVDKIRIKNELIQLRSQLKCKFNDDTNLFIVSDDYDKDVDIQAFIKNMMDTIPMWNSEYKNPWEICSSVAKTLDMEFFCDTNGHIQFRTPKYNKMPLSLLLKMLLLKDKENIKLYPESLENLFKSTQNSLIDEQEIINLQIQIQTVLLGSYPDQVITSQGDLVQADENNYFNVSKFLSVGRAVTNADLESLAGVLIDLRNRLTSKIGDNSTDKTGNDITKAVDEIFEYNNIGNKNVNVNRLKATNKLAQLISQKQKLTDKINKIKNQEVKFGGFDLNKLRASSITSLTKQEILSRFSDLIEDDYNDLIGPGSASRYIISDDRVINSNFTESDQNVFCRIDITGEIDLLKEGPGLLGGVPQIWAGATDFDLWRQYGWRSQGPINKPFFKDGPSQCAPYAQMLLSRAKKDAVRGTITIAGNEYYQLGDVVYVNSKELLYYVTNIKHNFSYGGSFTTTLDLRWGHPLGEYIATPLDVIGKVLIKNGNKFNKTVSYRQTAGKSWGVVVGTIKFSSNIPSASSFDFLTDMLSGANKKFNTAQLQNALLVINKTVNSVEKGVFPKVEIRSFTTSDTFTDDAANKADAIYSWLRNPSAIENGEMFSLAPTDFPAVNSKKILPFDQDLDPINISTVKVGNKERVPGEMAYNITNRDSSGSPLLIDIAEIVIVFKEKIKEA